MDEAMFCTNCGKQLVGSRNFCSSCGSKVGSDDLKIQDSVKAIPLVEDVGYDASKHRNAGILCFVAAGLIAVSCFMPYVLMTSTIGLSLGRTPFQFGAMETLSYQGPLILLGAAFFVFDGLRLLGVIAPDREIRNTFPLATCISSAAVILGAWSTSGWTGTSAMSIHLGYGGIIGLAGVAVGLVAIFVQRSA